MNTTDTFSARDRAVLRAVAAGRCEMSPRFGGQLVVDGIGCCDQFVGRRLTNAGLITPAASGAVRLTSSGAAVLGAPMHYAA